MNTVELRVLLINPHPIGSYEFYQYRNEKLSEAGFINLPKESIYGCQERVDQVIGVVYCRKANINGRTEYFQQIDASIVDPQIATLMAMKGEL